MFRKFTQIDFQVRKVSRVRKSWFFAGFRNGQFATLLMEPQADSQAEYRSLSFKFWARPRSGPSPGQPEVKPPQFQVEFDCQAADERPPPTHRGWSAGGQAPAGLYGPVAKEKNQCECPLTSRPRAGSCDDSSFCYKAYFDCYIAFEHDISQLPRCQMERASIVKVLRRGQLEAYVRPGRFSRLGVGYRSYGSFSPIRVCGLRV